MFAEQNLSIHFEAFVFSFTLTRMHSHNECIRCHQLTHQLNSTPVVSNSSLATLRTLPHPSNPYPAINSLHQPSSQTEPWWIWVEDPLNDRIYHHEYFVLKHAMRKVGRW